MNVDRCPTTSKIIHTTRDDARRHIASLYRAGKGNPDYAVYRCPDADHYHVGHSVVRLSKRIRRALRTRR